MGLTQPSHQARPPCHFEVNLMSAFVLSESDVRCFLGLTRPSNQPSVPFHGESDVRFSF